MDRKKKNFKKGSKPPRKQFKGNPKLGRKRDSVSGVAGGETPGPHAYPAKDETEDENFSSKGFASQMMEMNRKNKKSGGFQSMGLGPEIFRGVIKKGYKVPTPIQRKTIPVILEGRDVVGMARTGSGKTAAFLIPLFQKLIYSASKGVGVAANSRGARGLILAPTRELALQTLKFCKDLGRYTGLRSICVLGGDSMEKQFALMHENPDIVIATPGRFVHLCVEMGLKLNGIEYVVFDEADRLFEMGFGEQLREILGRLPENRQTVLFSATLPKLLVDFAKAGLTDPTLIRLDVDTKIPDTLKLAFFHTRPEGKNALLLHLLQNVIAEEQQAVIFAATRHHVEYLHLLLDAAEISNTFIFSQLDSAARKINAAKFGAKKARVLVVTDLAARGIDIPLLDNVINYHFPAKAKLFIHRVGRVARAGRPGNAFSFVAGDELAYFIDLQLFLGHSVMFAGTASTVDNWHNVIGRVPQAVNDDFADQLRRYHETSLDLETLTKTASNGYKQYLKSRPGASAESARRIKGLKLETMGIHPLLAGAEIQSSGGTERDDFLLQMKKFRPSTTIFEVGNTSKNDTTKAVMAEKRHKHTEVIERFRFKDQIDEIAKSQGGETTENKQDLEAPSQEDIQSAFETIVQSKAVTHAKVFVPKKKNQDKIVQRRLKKDDENYIAYQAKDFHTEAGYSMLTGFEAQASGAVLDLTGDDDQAMRSKKNCVKWDVKKRKYVKADQSEAGKKIKTESGVWIPASYKSDRYAKWRERSKLVQMQEEDADGDEENPRKRKFGGLPQNHPAMKKAREAIPKHKKGPRNEILRPEQILKARKDQGKKEWRSKMQNKKGGKSRKKK